MPPILFGGRRANRRVARNVLVYRRQWMFLVSGFFEPVFYLLALGQGLGSLVGAVPGPGGPIGYSHGFLRTLGKILSGIPCDLGYLWMLWDREKQCWHDKLANDVVVPVDAYPVNR